MNLPKYIEIGPFDFSVKIVTADELDDHFGDMKPDLERIRLGDWLSPGSLRETLMHEIMHAAFYAAGLRGMDDEAEEKQVVVLATTLLALLRRNPDLVAYLLADQ